MIVSHQHRFIFFAVPKTATHTIREALRQHKGSDDWEQQMLFGRQALPIAALADIGHGHISVQEIKRHLDADVWQSYFKFAFVRNPYDRYISTCFFLNRRAEEFSANPQPFLNSALSRPRFTQRVLVRPQKQQLIDAGGEIAMDYVGRYENLQQSYDEICSRIGIPTTDLGRKNPSEHKPYTEYYDDELRSRVGEFYAEDLAAFGYDFEPSGPTN